MSRLMSSCPNIDVLMGGVTVSCLLDTGSMVSTTTESFFLPQFEPWGPECLQSCHWLQLRAANGLAIPYIGYVELYVVLCGKALPHCGILVVKDPPGTVPSVPGVLGMKVISRCNQELFGACQLGCWPPHVFYRLPVAPLMFQLLMSGPLKFFFTPILISVPYVVPTCLVYPLVSRR